MNDTRRELFDKASKNILKTQQKYVADYEKRHSIKRRKFSEGEKVQYRNTKNDKRKGGKISTKWFPKNDFLIIKRFLTEVNCVELRKPTGKSTCKVRHINNIRKFTLKRKR